MGEWMRSPKNKSAYVDYQQRATEFSVGDLVSPFGSTNQNHDGRVQAVWPAIGMVDVEWPHGSERIPVEDLQRKPNNDTTGAPAIGKDNIPGGAGTVPVSGGPHVASTALSARRVAAAYLKKALYWAAPDRHYRATQGELDSNTFLCPKCKEGVLRSTSYKRTEGQSDRLLACPRCLFLVRRCDIIGHPEYEDDGLPGVQAGGK